MATVIGKPELTAEQLRKLRDTLIAAEDDRPFPYVDTVGKLTIGIGHNLTDKGISTAVRDLIFTEDLADVTADLDRRLPWWRELNDVRQRAVIELCFNMGIGSATRGLLSFRVTLANLKGGHYNAAAAGLLKSKWARDVKIRRATRLALMISTGEDPTVAVTR